MPAAPSPLFCQDMRSSVDGHSTVQYNASEHDDETDLYTVGLWLHHDAVK